MVISSHLVYEIIPITQKQKGMKPLQNKLQTHPILHNYSFTTKRNVSPFLSLTAVNSGIGADEKYSTSDNIHYVNFILKTGVDEAI